MRFTTFLSPLVPAFAGISLVAALSIAVPSHAEEGQQLKTYNDKVQYAIGVEVARNFRNQGLTLDLDLVMKGMRDGLSGGDLLVSEKELRNILISVQSDIRRKQALSKKGVTEDKGQ